MYSEGVPINKTLSLSHTHTYARSLPHLTPSLSPPLSPPLSSLMQDIDKKEKETRENIVKWSKMERADKVMCSLRVCVFSIEPVLYRTCSL